MRSRISTVQPVMVLRVTGMTTGASGSGDTYTYDIEWGDANVSGVKETSELLQSGSFRFPNLESYLTLSINKDLMRSLDYEGFESTQVMVYVPTADRLTDKTLYDTNQKERYSGWYVVDSVSPSLRQYSGSYYSEAKLKALYSVSNSEGAEELNALEHYYVNIGDPLVEHPNPRTVNLLENAVNNLSFVS